jgi:DegV family protein with EDD domain
MEECKKLVLGRKDNVGVVFVPETLEFLHRGGRIGGASRWFGTALNIKPILEVTNGRVEAIERVRTFKKATERAIEIVEERIAGQSPVRLAIIHANAKEDAERLLEAASLRLNPVERYITAVSPVVGTHAGPGTIGLAFMAG